MRDVLLFKIVEFCSFALFEGLAHSGPLPFPPLPTSKICCYIPCPSNGQESLRSHLRDPTVWVVSVCRPESSFVRRPAVLSGFSRSRAKGGLKKMHVVEELGPGSADLSQLGLFEPWLCLISLAFLTYRSNFSGLKMSSMSFLLNHRMIDHGCFPAANTHMQQSMPSYHHVLLVFGQHVWHAKHDFPQYVPISPRFICHKSSPLCPTFAGAPVVRKSQKASATDMISSFMSGREVFG